MIDDRPNVLVITSHDIGQHLGCYGVPTVATDAIDALAADGVLFERSFCTAPLCSASRASIFTGRYPHSTGVLGLTHGGFGWDLNDDEIHLAGYLRDAGYRCEQVGTMHETRRPATHWGYACHHVDPQGTAAEIAAIVQNRIRDMSDARVENGQPWYIHAGFFEPHTPFNWGGATPDSSKGVNIPPWLVDNDDASTRFAAYQGAIRNLNIGVQRILDTLSASGQSDDTLVVFTADHGIPFPRAKASLYDAGLEVALVVRWPRRGWVGGRRQREMICNVDHVPTLLDVLGIPISGRVQGRSYRALLDGESYTANEAVFGELTYFNSPFFAPRRTVRTDRHRLIMNATTDRPFGIEHGVTPLPQIVEQWQHHVAYGAAPRLELYDMNSDPLQLDNLATRADQAELLRDMKRRLLEWMTETSDPLLQGVPTPPSLRNAIAALQA